MEKIIYADNSGKKYYWKGRMRGISRDVAQSLPVTVIRPRNDMGRLWLVLNNCEGLRYQHDGSCVDGPS